MTTTVTLAIAFFVLLHTKHVASHEVAAPARPPLPPFDAEHLCDTQRTKPGIEVHCTRGRANATFLSLLNCAFGHDPVTDACRATAQDCDDHIGYGMTHVAWHERLTPLPAPPQPAVGFEDAVAAAAARRTPFPRDAANANGHAWSTRVADGQSSIRCIGSRRLERGRQGAAHASPQLCVLQNVVIDYSKTQQTGSYITFGAGAIRAHCNAHTFSAPPTGATQNGGGGWDVAMTQGVECVPPTQPLYDADGGGDGGDGHSDVTVSRGTAVFLYRDEWRNLFHTLGDYVKTFLALHSLQLLPTVVPVGLDDARPMQPDVQVIIGDTYPAGPFYALWTHFMPADARSPVHAQELHDRARRVWYDRLVLSFLPRSAFWDFFYGVTPCVLPPLMIDARRFLVRSSRLPDSDATANAQADGSTPDLPDGSSRRDGQLPTLDHFIATDVDTPHRPVRIVLISRPPNYRGRVILNEAELHAAVDARYGSRVSFERVDMSTLPLSRQFQTARDADVLIGMHGAGLAHELLLRPGAVAVELFCMNTYTPAYYQSVAAFSGAHYLRWTNPHAHLHEAPGPKSFNFEGDDFAANMHVHPPDFLALVHTAVHTFLTRRGPPPGQHPKPNLQSLYP